jgi:diaminopimelate decarboxylase
VHEHTIQNIGVSKLAAEFGTPFYVYDGAEIERAYQDLRTRLDPPVRIFYSLKPNPNISVVKVLHRQGAGAEVCSMGEFTAALRAGVQPKDILFTGPGKDLSELAALVEHDVRAVICESLAELTVLDSLAQSTGKVVPVLLRLNPTIGVQGGRLTMAGKPREFGIDEEQVLAETDLVARHPNLRFIGIHVFTGTRILDPNVVVQNTEHILDLAGTVSETLGFELELVDVGGGIGIAYYPGEQDPDVDVLADGINKAVAGFRARHPKAEVALEPGRYLVGRAGTYVVQVRYVKNSKGERFAITDGGTHQNMAAVGMGTYLKRNFPMSLVSDLDRPNAGPCNITGRLLTPTDTIGKRVEMPELSPGDLIGVQRSGAYGPTASITYMNGQGFPAEVLVHQGRAHLIRERDAVEDLFTRQRVVDLDADEPSDEVGQVVREEIARLAERPVAGISNDDRLFYDLPLDSVSIMELLAKIEDRLGIVVDPDELDEQVFGTVGTIIEFTKRNGGIAAAPKA